MSFHQLQRCEPRTLRLLDIAVPCRLSCLHVECNIRLTVQPDVRIMEIAAKTSRLSSPHHIRSCVWFRPNRALGALPGRVRTPPAVLASILLSVTLRIEYPNPSLSQLWLLCLVHPQPTLSLCSALCFGRHCRTESDDEAAGDV